METAKGFIRAKKVAVSAAGHTSVIMQSAGVKMPLESYPFHALVGGARTIPCDAVLMCGGWTPSLHLFSHTKGSLDWDAAAKAYLPGHKTEAGHVAGAGRGLWGIASALEDGAKAGAGALRDLGRKAGTATYAVTGDRTGTGITQK